MKKIIFLIILLAMTTNDCWAQSWMKLVALESTREDVEKILGEPAYSFPEYASYKTSWGRFHLWYSAGECRKNFEGLQYKVKANLMSHLLVYLDSAPLMKSALSNLSEYTREENVNKDGYLYISKDESIVYETFMSPERIKSIDIGPSKDKKALLCKSSDLK